MAIKDIINHLKYSDCECRIDYREELGVVNGVCQLHNNSKLMVDGILIDVFLKEVERKKFDRRSSEIV